MIKYNDSSIFVGEIKEILRSFWLPTCRILGDVGESAGLPDGTHFICRGSFYVILDGRPKRLSLYRRGEKLFNFSKRLGVRSNYYDSHTHAYLGDYLRFLRDYDGINLMQMYNCFTWEMPKYVSGLNAGTSESPILFSSDDPSYDLYMFPVKPGRDYTLAIDWHGSISMCACVYENNVMVDEDKANSIAHATYASFSGLRFLHPVLYRGLEGLGDYEELKLFVKVPTDCKSSIVFLEGDWRDSSKVYLNGILQSKSMFSDVSGQPIEYSSKSQLLTINDGQRNLLSDRMFEYISSNVICPFDEVDENIVRLQHKYSSEDGRAASYYGFPGIWSDSLRRRTWHGIASLGLLDSKFDLTGYYDKDAEAELGPLPYDGGSD